MRCVYVFYICIKQRFKQNHSPKQKRKKEIHKVSERERQKEGGKTKSFLKLLKDQRNKTSLEAVCQKNRY